ncbi:phenylacetate--CoA ligase family protein [Marinobacter sp. 1Y8]
MKKIFEVFYHRAPVFFQNILVSIYGYKLHRERYSTGSDNNLKALKCSELFSQSEMDNFVNSRFAALAKHSIETVPFYHSWAIKNGIKSSDISGVEDLSLFPIITKDILRRNPRDFVSSIAKDTIKLSTSGTSGKPIDIICSKADRTYHYAFFSRLRHWFGLNKNSKRATFFGRIIVLPEQEKPPFWRMDMAQNNLLMSSYHLSQANLIHYYRKLNIFKPDEVIGYPSSLYELARFIINRQLQPISCTVVFTTAETLLDYQRKALEKAFSAPIVDQYGCTEMAFFVSQCEYGTVHNHPEHGILETVGSTGESLNEEPGTVLATGLVNWTMPLIRYEVGDRLTLSSFPAQCPCGRAFPVIVGIEGRVDDVIYRKDGTPVGRLDPVFKGGSGIVNAKITQYENSDVQVFVEPDATFTETNKKWLRRELKKRLGDDIELTITEVLTIKKQPNGKFKAVESFYDGSVNNPVHVNR